MKYIPAVFFSLFALQMFSQNSDLDSLKIVLNTKPEKEQAEIYNQIASELYYDAPDSCIYYAEKALAIAEKLDLKEEQYYAFIHLGIGNSVLSRNDQAVSYHLKALELAKIIKDNKLIGSAHNDLGIDYKYLGRFDKALENFLMSLAIKEERSVDGKKLFSERSISNTMNNIGVIYDEMGEYDKALDYYYKVLEVRKSISDLKGEASVLHNIGVVFEEKGEFLKALEYYRQSLEIKKKFGNLRSMAITLGNIGIVYLDLGDYDNALNYHYDALEIYRKSNSKIGIANMSNSIADIYLEKGEPQKAFPYIMDGLRYAEQSNARRILSDSYRFLSMYYKAINNYKKAYETQLLLMALRDSLFSLELAGQVAEMQTRYETEKKEKEIEILARDKEIDTLKIKKQSTQLYFLLAFILAITIISILIYSRIRLKQITIRAKLEKKNLETEQHLLRSQMNPHFIFNSMNSIQSYISGNDSFTAMTYLSKFARLMRLILENSKKSMIRLSEEIDTLTLYMDLEKIRFKDKFDFEVKIAPGIVQDAVYVPPMLIQPFIENSIKHGFRNKVGKGFLSIDYQFENGVLKCSVRDDGIGREKAGKFNKQEKAGHRSLGMELTKQRLITLNPKTEKKYSIQVIDLKDKPDNIIGTEVIVKMPFETE